MEEKREYDSRKRIKEIANEMMRTQTQKRIKRNETKNERIEKIKEEEEEMKKVEKAG